MVGKGILTCSMTSFHEWSVGSHLKTGSTHELQKRWPHSVCTGFFITDKHTPHRYFSLIWHRTKSAAKPPERDLDVLSRCRLSWLREWNLGSDSSLVFEVHSNWDVFVVLRWYGGKAAVSTSRRLTESSRPRRPLQNVTSAAVVSGFTSYEVKRCSHISSSSRHGSHCPWHPLSMQAVPTRTQKRPLQQTLTCDPQISLLPVFPHLDDIAGSSWIEGELHWKIEESNKQNQLVTRSDFLLKVHPIFPLLIVSFLLKPQLSLSQAQALTWRRNQDHDDPKRIRKYQDSIRPASALVKQVFPPRRHGVNGLCA